MAISTPTSISQRFHQIKEFATRCEQEFAAIKSPHAEHEEKVAVVNGQLEQAWQRLYANTNSVNRSDVQGEIVQYGGKLNELEMSYAAGLESAETSYGHRIEVVWERFCGHVVASFGVPLIKRLLIHIDGQALDIPGSRFMTPGDTVHSDSATMVTNPRSNTPMQDTDSGSNDDYSEVSYYIL